MAGFENPAFLFLEGTLQKRRFKPRNTRNTRKAGRRRFSFRVFRVFRGSDRSPQDSLGLLGGELDRQSGCLKIGWQPELVIRDLNLSVLFELLDVIRKLLLNRLLFQILFDVRSNFGEFLLPGRYPFEHLDDVISGYGGDNVADFVGAESEGNGFELGGHLASRERVIPALEGGRGLFRKVSGQFGKILTGPGAF